jgi:hypothetical protein
MMLGNIVKRIEELSYMPCRNNAAYCKPMEDAVGYNYMGGYVVYHRSGFSTLHPYLYILQLVVGKTHTAL